MIERIRRLRTCAADIGALRVMQILLFATTVPALVRLDLPRLHRLLEPSGKRSSRPVDDSSRMVAHVDAILRAGRPCVSGGCLTRGLTLYYFLRRAGMDIDLCFGVRVAEDGEADGHCWLEMRGEPFLERVDPRRIFMETYRMAPVGPAV